MSPQRIQRRRTKGWRAPEGAIYVGRGTKWGNPWRMDDFQSAADVARCYRQAIKSGRNGVWDNPDHERWTSLPSTEEIRAALAGHDLMCWCPLDQPCHADILLEIANGGEPR